jgi:hypothetical protein
MPDRPNIAYSLLLIGLLAGSCAPAPTAQTPGLVDLSVPGSASSEWVAVRQAGGSFHVLPLNQANAGLRLTLEAPYPGSLVVSAVDPSSGAATTLPVIFGGQEGSPAGFHRVDSIDTSARPQVWHVTVRPPDTFAALPSFRITIAHKDATAQSDPLVVTLDGAGQS